MEIKGKVHLMFEQSGVFKNEFKKLGYEAYDYDIQDNFGETDFKIDLFAEIEKGYSGGVSIFDSITCDDLVIAFFPCIKFCSVMEQIQHEDFYDQSQKHNIEIFDKSYYIRKWNVLRRYSQERFYFYDIALKLTAICQIRNLRMIMENPYHPTNFTNHFWFMRISLIDKDRTRRGDFFKKPTAYWYVNCEPTFGESYQPTPKEKIKTITAGSGASKNKRKMSKIIRKDELDLKYIDKSTKKGICDEERSMISPDYARNFICDFILGKTQKHTQLSLFE